MRTTIGDISHNCLFLSNSNSTASLNETVYNPSFVTPRCVSNCSHTSVSFSRQSLSAEGLSFYANIKE